MVNSSFVQLGNTPTKLKKTRVTTAKLGLRAYKKKHVAAGYKIMDITLLQENLASFAACAMCKRSSCLKIVTDPGKKRYGLAEHYSVVTAIVKKTAIQVKGLLMMVNKVILMSMFDLCMLHKEWDIVVLVNFVHQWTYHNLLRIEHIIIF